MAIADQERAYWEQEAQGWADEASGADLRSKSASRLVPEQDTTDNGPEGRESSDLPLGYYICPCCRELVFCGNYTKR